jgi:hypothetical protein
MSDCNKPAFREHRGVPLLPLPPPGEAPPVRPPEPDLRITFRVTGDGPPGHIRARRLLKYAGRVLGLKNLKYEEIERPDTRGRKG